MPRKPKYTPRFKLAVKRSMDMNPGKQSDRQNDICVKLVRR